MNSRRNRPLFIIVCALIGSLCFTAIGTVIERPILSIEGSSVNQSDSSQSDSAQATPQQPSQLRFKQASTEQASSKQNSKPRSERRSPAHIYMVRPDILAIDIAAPEVTLAKQLAYSAKPGDSVVERDGRSHIKRDGTLIGTLVGPNQDILYTYDQTDEDTFQVNAVAAPRRYQITSENDSHYALGKNPEIVFRKTKPAALSQTTDRQRQWPTAHTLYLVLPHPLSAGKTYQLQFSELGLEDDSFTYSPQTTRSEAVHVSQIGFRPTDSFKAGYLSTWMGNGGGLDYADNLPFSLVNTHTDQIVYRGQAVRKHGVNQLEGPRERDYTLTEVHQLDFSDFDQPGEYRLCVEGIGCSFDFEIRDRVWEKAFYTSARGFYHQRSGIAIGRPHSAFERPRAFHPEDGMKIYQSNTSLLDVDMGIGTAETFKTLLANKTNTEVPNAWGGYFDAADWDRRIQNLAVPRYLLELHNLFPDYFKAINLNLPESNNELPDILDEALWSIDFFRRLQLPNGGIRGGIESAEHPQRGETSWQESLTVMAYAPDVWSSYMYAGVAARAAYTLKAYDPQLADIYTDSALKAMTYAETHYQADNKASNHQAADNKTEDNANNEKRVKSDNPKLHHVDDQRNLAALELYRLTEDTQWHDLFLATTVFSDDTAEVFVHNQQDQADAAFLYSRLSPDQIEQRSEQHLEQQAKKVQRNARMALLRQAARQINLTKTSAFGWSRQNPDAPVGWRNGLGAPTGINLLRAHALTQNKEYLQAGISGTQFAVGANPDNLVFTTGIGDRTPKNPLISDYRITHQEPPPGITLFGPADFGFYKDYWLLDQIRPVTFPNPRQWPTVENYFDVYSNPIHAEFTVQYMVASTYTWGYLAARQD